MKVLGVIPARYNSTRLPGKPLLNILGKSMIQRVYEQAIQASKLDQLIVATDDQRIFDHVRGFGGNVILTSEEHQSGTARCAEVAESYSGYNVIVNIQGDEPFIKPSQIDLLANCFNDNKIEIATLAKRILDMENLLNSDNPKVLLNVNNDAIYFSRSVIPFVRGCEQEQWLNKHVFYKHIGLYAYKVEVLLNIAKLAPSSLELIEKLEQLGWLENGYKIRVNLTEDETLSIDSMNDYNEALILAKREKI